MTETKIDAKTTKPVLWKAYKKAMAEIQALRAESPETDRAKADMEVARLEDSAGLLTPANVLETVLQFRSKHQSVFAKLGEDLEQVAAKLVDTNDLIKVKEKQLKELYQIEREADSLAALHAANAEAQKDLGEQRAKANRDWEEERKQTILAQKRNVESWEYDFARRKQKDVDDLNDELHAKKREFDAACEARDKVITEREDEQSEAIAKAKELETELEALKTSLPQQIEQAEAKGKAAAEKSANFAKQLEGKEYQAQIKVLEGKVEVLTAQLAAAVEESADLKQKLDSASERVQAVAMGALETKQANDTITSLRETITTMSPSVAGNGRRT